MGDDTASCRENPLSVFLEEVLERLSFQPSKILLSMQRKDLSQLHSRALLDQDVQFCERDLKVLGQAGTQGRFPSPPKSKKRDDPALTFRGE